MPPMRLFSRICLAIQFLNIASVCPIRPLEKGIARTGHQDPGFPIPLHKPTLPPLSLMQHARSISVQHVTLRLRGGHRKGAFKKKKAAYREKGMKVSKRIHGIMRPHQENKRNARWAKLREARHDELLALNQSDTMEGSEEAKPKRTLREVRLWETTLGDVMKSIQEYRILHPEVFEEEERLRLDNHAEWKVERWKENVILPEYDDEEELWDRENNPEWISRRQESHYSLALCYDSGYGVERVDKKKAFDHFKAAAELGQPQAATCVAYCYMLGDGVPENETLGAKWYKIAAENGCYDGMFNLGLCHRDGVGMPVNEIQAVHWFNQSAANAHPDGLYALAKCTQAGYGGLERDWRKAVTIFRRIIDKYDHPVSELSLAECYLQGLGVRRDVSFAAKLLVRPAQGNMPAAQHLLGLCLMSGEAELFDFDAGKKLVEQAAAAGQEDAVAFVSDVLMRGRDEAVQAAKEFIGRREEGADDQVYDYSEEEGGEGQSGFDEDHVPGHDDDDDDDDDEGGDDRKDKAVGMEDEE